MNFTDLFNNINPREVINNLPDGVIVTDSYGRIIWVNEKASIIFQTERHILKFLHFDSLIENGMALACTAAAKRESIVTKTRTFDGNEIYVEINAKSFVDQYFITLRNTTEITKIYEQADKNYLLNKEKNVMLSNLSSELKSPVQSITGFSQALLYDDNINEKQSRYLKIINKNATELMDFLCKFIEFSQAESDLFDSQLSEFNPIKAIQEIIENKFRDKKAVIGFDKSAFNETVIYGDENLFKLVITNVIGTSLEQAGKINIVISYPNTKEITANALDELTPYWKISVNDNGIGFSDSEIKEIFNPYAQIKNLHKKTLMRAFSLGTAYNIIRNSGGLFKIESSLMKGSQFVIILPIRKTDE